MALKHGKVNALNVLGLRKVSFPARHFSYTHLNKTTPAFIKQLDEWIYNNLNGRYYIGSDIALANDSNSTVIYVSKVGFENAKELSFFQLACPFASS